MHFEPHDFLETIATPLGWYYLVCAGANVLALGRAGRAGHWLRAAAWAGMAAVFALLGALSFGGSPPEMPGSLKSSIDGVLGPVTFTLGSLALLTVLYLGRRFFVRTAVAWSILTASLLLMGLSLSDYQFAQIVLRPDNVPIVAMVYLLGFFIWLGVAQAVENDQRLRRRQGPVEKNSAKSTLVWPDLVYIELICMVIVTAAMVVWSLALRAPLEPPANPTVTPNPSKAPWYFLGLQEMLVFFDPAMAGVILPVLIILGLAAIPYLDVSPKGSGYYTIVERRWSFITFMFGFLQLWIVLILIGTFFRGPNWNFFGLYEPRDPHRVLALNNIKLSEYVWVLWLGRSMPQVSAGSGVLAQLGGIAWREMPGLVLLGLYFLGLPVWLGRTVMRRFRREMGRTRYWIVILLLLMMLALPLKMILRWTMNMSYVVSIPEYSFNF